MTRVCWLTAAILFSSCSWPKKSVQTFFNAQHGEVAGFMHQNNTGLYTMIEILSQIVNRLGTKINHEQRCCTLPRARAASATAWSGLPGAFPGVVPHSPAFIALLGQAKPGSSASTSRASRHFHTNSVSTNILSVEFPRRVFRIASVFIDDKSKAGRVPGYPHVTQRPEVLEFTLELAFRGIFAEIAHVNSSHLQKTNRPSRRVWRKSRWPHESQHTLRWLGFIRKAVGRSSSLRSFSRPSPARAWKTARWRTKRQIERGANSGSRILLLKWTTRTQEC